MSEAPSLYADLYQRVSEILYYVWDPIGVLPAAGARDEYDAYVPTVVRLLYEEKEREEIIRYLLDLQTGHMGMNLTDDARARAAHAVQVLIEHNAWIKEVWSRRR